jgi:hypothetical protein
MAASVLNSPRAFEMSVFVVCAFVRQRCKSPKWMHRWLHMKAGKPPYIQMW